MTTNIFAVEEDNVSLAWLRAIQHLADCGGEGFNLMVSIGNPTQTEPTMHTAYEQLLSDHGLLTLKQIVFRPIACGFTPSPGDMVKFNIGFSFRNPIAINVRKM